jgi:hypothetical protein
MMMDGLPDVFGHLAEEDKQAAADSTSRALFGGSTELDGSQTSAKLLRTTRCR